MSEIKTCDVCGAELIESDGYLSCPVYLGAISKSDDEHTSYPIKKE